MDGENNGQILLKMDDLEVLVPLFLETPNQHLRVKDRESGHFRALTVTDLYDNKFRIDNTHRIHVWYIHLHLA